MDTHRIILFVIFSLSLFLLMDAWQKEHAPAAPAQQAGPGQAQTDQAKTAQIPSPRQASAPVLAEPQGALQSGEKIRVQTDLLLAEIDTAGGDLRRLELLQHRDTKDPARNFLLLQSGDGRAYIAQTGLIGGELPTHKTRFTATASDYRLDADTDKLEVRLEAPQSGALKVAKIYTFRKGSYLIDVSYQISNGGPAAIQPFAYYQFVHDGNPPGDDPKFVGVYSGAAFYTEQGKFQKAAFSDIEQGKAEFVKNSNNGWVAMLQHYFLGAWLPRDGLPREFYARKLDSGGYSAGVIVPVGEIDAGKTALHSIPLYAGPQDQGKLSQLAPGLDLTVDYGWLTVIAVPLFKVLSWLYGWAKNWGVAIILLTVLIKLIFFPLSAASYRSMAKMRVLTPKLQKIKEQYGDDRQRMHQAMMDLYKTEKVNPLGGCLPVVVQIPVFIALYWVLLASVELRHAPFMLWVHDLSSPDPYYVLPVLMGATMIWQTYLNPTPPDPIQAKVMKFMPFAFSIFFLFFPAGLVLYWLVNNILSIAQQWQITRAAERALPAHGKR